MSLLHVTVQSHERALERTDGTLTRVLEPGRYRRQRRASYEHVDVRERLSTVAPQEVPTADGVSVKVSAAIRWSIVDAAAYVGTIEAESLVYLAAQVALRDALSGLELADVTREGRRTVTEALTAAAQQAGLGVGIAVAEVVVKDVVLPPEIRAAYAEIVTARQRSQVQLETARSEAAALRSMANTAKLMDDHPALARLRLIQSAPYGTQVVLQVRDADVTPDA